MSHSATGYKGVYKQGKKFRAEHKGKSLGTYSTAVEAAVAYAKRMAKDGEYPAAAEEEEEREREQQEQDEQEQQEQEQEQDEEEQQQQEQEKLDKSLLPRSPAS